MTDRQLSRTFRLSDFPGYALAGEAEVARLQELVDGFLQPFVDGWGPILVSSWFRPGDAGSAHATGDAVDFVVVGGGQDVAAEWAAARLVGSFGELIVEPDNRAEGGGNAHLHVTRWPVGGRSEFLREGREGTYTPAGQLSALHAALLVGGLLALAAVVLIRHPR